MAWCDEKRLLGVNADILVLKIEEYHQSRMECCHSSTDPWLHYNIALCCISSSGKKYDEKPIAPNIISSCLIRRGAEGRDIRCAQPPLSTVQVENLSTSYQKSDGSMIAVYVGLCGLDPIVFPSMISTWNFNLKTTAKKTGRWLARERVELQE